MTGIKLLDALEFIKITERIASKIISQILSALAYCQSRKVFHRNLNINSIWIEPSNLAIKVIDFGLADIFYPIPEEDEIINFASYFTPPEYFEKHYEVNSDIWSIGVLMHILLTGYEPFSGQTAKELAESIRKGDCIIKDVSNDAKDLLEKMINVSPYKRCNAMNAYTHKWFTIKDELGKDENSEVNIEHFIVLYKQIIIEIANHTKEYRRIPLV